MKSRLYFFLLLYLLLSVRCFAQVSNEQLSTKIDALLQNNFFETSSCSIDIFDLTEQRSLYSHNNKLLMHPASNMKILTSSAGLLFLADYNFETKLFYTGEIVNNVLTGDIYIKGGCDPNFSTDDMESFIDAIELAGIKVIKGGIYGDVSMKDSLFWGKGWMWDDDPGTDFPYLTALNINENTVTVNIKGSQPGLPADVTLIPESGYFPLLNNSITVGSSSNTIDLTRSWLNRSNTIVVSGEIPPGEMVTQKVNVFAPELYFLTLFKEKLLSRGLMSGQIGLYTAPENAALLHTFNRPYDSIITKLNKVSHNLSAEMTIYALAEKYYGRPATASNGIKLIDSLIILAGGQPDIYRLVDGSGVSHYNLVSAELILSILKYFYYEQPLLYENLYNSFPIAGVDGTLEKRMKDSPAYKNVNAKTGTLSGVSTLSGYVNAANNHNIAFSIFMQNYKGNSSIATGFQDEICRILSEYK